MVQLTSVSENIVQFLERNLSASSFFLTKRIAGKFFLTNLAKVCDEFAVRNVQKLVKEKEFRTLKKEYISFLITTPSSTSYWNEDSKLAMILKWIKADIKNRRRYLMEFATLIHFQEISSGLGKYLAHDEEICYKSSEFMDLLTVVPFNSRFVQKKSPSAALSSGANALMIFHLPSKQFKIYDPSKRGWDETPPFPGRMNLVDSFTAVLMDNFIYILFANKKTFRLNMKDSSWEDAKSIKKDHSAPCACVYGEDIFIAGSKSMERYRTSESKWKEINNSSDANCCQCALVVHGNMLYTIGGYDNGDLVDVNRYSPQTSTWSSVALMPSPRRHAAASVHDDRIFVAGGQRFGRYVNEFMCLDVKSDTWTYLPPMLKDRGNFGLCALGNKMYAVGNRNQECRVETYDFVQGRWSVEIHEDDHRYIHIMGPATIAAELPES